jgi:hypothetical protein
LIAVGEPDFIEVKAVTYCGKSDASSLTMANVPWHAEVCVCVVCVWCVCGVCVVCVWCVCTCVVCVCARVVCVCARVLCVACVWCVCVVCVLCVACVWYVCDCVMHISPSFVEKVGGCCLCADVCCAVPAPARACTGANLLRGPVRCAWRRLRPRGGALALVLRPDG